MSGAPLFLARDLELRYGPEPRRSQALGRLLRPRGSREPGADAAAPRREAAPRELGSGASCLRRGAAFAAERLEVMEGECLALLGPNGSGKTTLLKALGGLLKPSAGSLLFLGEDASSSRSLRRRGVYLHQAPYILSGSVSYNLYYGARARGLPRGAADDGVREALSLLGLSGFERRCHRELSGGEAQRVALARAFAAGADVLLLDEPTASADAASARLVLEALRARRAAGATIVFSTHDPKLAEALATRTLVLEDGRAALS